MDRERGSNSWEQRRRREETSAMLDSRLSGKILFSIHKENWCEEDVDDEFSSPREHGAYRKAEVEEADGPSSRKEGVGFALTFHGNE